MTLRQKDIGRIIGLLFLGQVVLGILVYLQWLRPVTAPDFLTSAAESAMTIRIALLVSLCLGGLTLAIAIVALPVFRRYSERMAFVYLALCIVGLSTLAMENSALRGMLSLSQEYAKSDAPHELLRTLGETARSTGYLAHHTNVTVAHGTFFLFNVILFRFALVPRALATAGIAATVLSTTAVAMPLLGYPFVFPLVLPTGLTQLALILWLMARGFGERRAA